MAGKTTENNGRSNGKRRGRVQNLIPWQPGQSGNPGGRPRRKPITDAYKELLNAEDGKGNTGAQALAWSILRKALLGDVAAAKEITDRVEGTVRQAMDILFGELSDEQLKDFLASQYGTVGAGDAGGEAAGDGPAPSDAEPSADSVGEQPVRAERKPDGAV